MPLYSIHFGQLRDPWIRLVHQGSEPNFYANYAGSRFITGPQEPGLMVQILGQLRRLALDIILDDQDHPAGPDRPFIHQGLLIAPNIPVMAGMA